MKTSYLLLALLLPVMAFSQRKPKIKGSRVVTEVKQELPPFNAIQLNSDMDITLKKSFGPGYTIVADDNLIDIYKFKVEDSTLVISSFYDVSSKKQLEITIEYVELSALSVKEGSVVSKEQIATDALFVDAFGASRLDLQVSAGVADINLEDSAKADFNLDVDSLNVRLAKRAESYMYAVTESNTVSVEANSSLTFQGTSDRMALEVTGNAKYKGEKMEAGSVRVMMDNDAQVRLYAFRELVLSSKGNARMLLYGNPKITIEEFLNTSQLLKKDSD
ncbi:MAG: DUF2807 domain-containing protein [Bacteroidota bacterium]